MLQTKALDVVGVLCENFVDGEAGTMKTFFHIPLNLFCNERAGNDHEKIALQFEISDRTLSKIDYLHTSYMLVGTML